MPLHFYTLDEVCEILAIEKPQGYSLVRSGELRAIKLGGRGQWRIEDGDLKAFLERAYAQTEAEIQANRTKSPKSSARSAK